VALNGIRVKTLLERILSREVGNVLNQYGFWNAVLRLGFDVVIDKQT